MTLSQRWIGRRGASRLLKRNGGNCATLDSTKMPSVAKSRRNTQRTVCSDMSQNAPFERRHAAPSPNADLRPPPALAGNKASHLEVGTGREPRPNRTPLNEKRLARLATGCRSAGIAVGERAVVISLPLRNLMDYWLSGNDPGSRGLLGRGLHGYKACPLPADLFTRVESGKKHTNEPK